MEVLKKEQLIPAGKAHRCDINKNIHGLETLQVNDQYENKRGGVDELEEHLSKSHLSLQILSLFKNSLC